MISQLHFRCPISVNNQCIKYNAMHLLDDDDVEIMFFRLARNPYIHCAKWYIIEEADSQSRADPSTYEPTQEDTNFTNAKLMLKMLELKKYNDSIRPYYHLVYGSINSEELVN